MQSYPFTILPSPFPRVPVAFLSQQKPQAHPPHPITTQPAPEGGATTQQRPPARARPRPAP
jgi:hypothetical protein